MVQGVSNNPLSAANESCHDCAEIKETLTLILAELQALRLEKLPASPEKIEELLTAIFEIFQDDEFSAFCIFLECDADAALRAAVSVCLKGKLTIRSLSLILSKSVGRHGSYVLERGEKTREGRYYKIIVME